MVLTSSDLSGDVRTQYRKAPRDRANAVYATVDKADAGPVTSISAVLELESRDGASARSIELRDDGVEPDDHAGDGTYSAWLNPPGGLLDASGYFVKARFSGEAGLARTIPAGDRVVSENVTESILAFEESTIL